MDAEHLSFPDDVVRRGRRAICGHHGAEPRGHARRVRPRVEAGRRDRAGQPRRRRGRIAAGAGAWFAPAARKLGWRTEFSFERYARWAARTGGVRLVERRAMPPLGHFSLIRFAKEGGEGRARQSFPRRDPSGRAGSALSRCADRSVTFFSVTRDSPNRHSRADDLTTGAQMGSFLEALRTQRWDDHRYYHHSRINQSLHFVSAMSFLFSYVMIFKDPAISALAGWLVAMTTRQSGHFFFEPKDYDVVNHASHEYKEQIKVGYNLRRKVVLLTIWALSPLPLTFDPTLVRHLHAACDQDRFHSSRRRDLACRRHRRRAVPNRAIVRQSRTCRPAWYGPPRFSPIRSTTSNSITRRRWRCCAGN